MKTLFVHHRIDAAPRQWQALAQRLATEGAQRIAGEGGALYGIWRSQIGRPRDELQALTAWPGAVHAADAERALLEGEPDVWIKRSETLTADAAADRQQAAYPPGQLRLSLVRHAGAALGRSSSTSAPAPGPASRRPTIRR